MIKSVIFDLGGVYFTDGTKIAIEKISKKYNLQFESVQEILKTGSEISTIYRRGEITFNEFWNKVKNILKINADNNELNKLWVESYDLMQGTIEIIKQLKEKGIKIYYLSDNVKERVEYLQTKFNFLENFIDGLFSNEVHRTKKDGVNVFKLALKKTKDKPEDVVYIDDKKEYVETAKKIGMFTIHFKNPEQLKEELINLGIL